MRNPLCLPKMFFQSPSSASPHVSPMCTLFSYATPCTSRCVPPSVPHCILQFVLSCIPHASPIVSCIPQVSLRHPIRLTLCLPSSTPRPQMHDCTPPNVSHRVPPLPQPCMTVPPICHPMCHHSREHACLLPPCVPSCVATATTMHDCLSSYFLHDYQLPKLQSKVKLRIWEAQRKKEQNLNPK